MENEVLAVEKKEISKDEKTMGMFCHLLSFTGYMGIPFGNIMGPLVLWLIKREESSFIDECGKESVNFQISMTIYALVNAILVLVFIGIVGLLVLVIIDIVCTIKATIKANEGVVYQYPMTIRFIK